MSKSYSSLKEENMLWLQAIHFQNPLAVMQKAQKEDDICKLNKDNTSVPEKARNVFSVPEKIIVLTNGDSLHV